MNAPFSRRHRWLPALLLAFGRALAAPPSCALPAEIDAPTVRPAHDRNPDASYDYLAFVLSWSPQFCEEQRHRPPEQQARSAHQCFSANRFEWVVHGLWPQSAAARSSRDHPRHCQPAAVLPVALIRQHLCTVPGAELMQNEWQAHGSCGWAAPERYFADIEALYARIARPSTSALTGERQPLPNRLYPVRAGDVKQAFVATNPGLRTSMLRVTVARGNLLDEVWLCTDKTLAPIACPRGGAPDDQTIRLRSPHN